MGVRVCNLSKCILTHVEGNELDVLHMGHLVEEYLGLGSGGHPDACQSIMLKNSDVLDTHSGVSWDDITNSLRWWVMTSPIHMVEAVLSVQLPDVLVMMWLSDVSLCVILVSTLVHMVLVQLYRA